MVIKFINKLNTEWKSRDNRRGYIIATAQQIYRIRHKIKEIYVKDIVLAMSQRGVTISQANKSHKRDKIGDKTDVMGIIR